MMPFHELPQHQESVAVLPAGQQTKTGKPQLLRRVVLACLLIFGGFFGIRSGLAWSSRLAAYEGYLKYEPQEGDVIFQSLPYGPVVLAIEGTTRSPYSHCGIVAKKDSGDGNASEWVVYEALGTVHATSLKDFLYRGRDGGFVVYRLRDGCREHIPATLKCCEAYMGRPYDFWYKLDDENIYCSELVYKAYRDATNGQQLGEIRKFGEMNWQPYETLIKQVEGGEVPVDREMITPVDLAKAPQLEPVFSHRLKVEQASEDR